MQLTDHASIAALIPHQGEMCLIDQVLDWDAEQISARSGTVHQSSNPLLQDGQLYTVVLVEYAAQAAAIHAALAGEGMGRDRAAVVGAIKSLQLHVPVVATAITELTLTARCILNDPGGAIYQLSAQAADETLMEARVVLVLPQRG